MYRPKGWVNPFDKEIQEIEKQAKRRGITDPWLGESSVGHDAYEAGADAILEGLKKKGKRQTFSLAIEGKTKMIFLSELESKLKGTLVFIPEEVEDEASNS